MPRTVRYLLAVYGGRNLEVREPKDVFDRLYNQLDLSLEQIAEKIGMTRQAVAGFAKSHGFKVARRGRPATIDASVEKLGYPSVYEYCRRNGRKTFEVMATELGVDKSVVQKHYAEFLRVFEERKHGPDA